MSKYLKTIVGLGLAVIFMVAYLTTYEYVVYFHEQHHLFRFSWAYISETIHQHGLWYLLTEFVVQFGYFTWLGSLVWTALEVATFAMASGAIRRLTGFRDLAQLGAIPAVWMFFQTVSIDDFPIPAIKIFVWTLLVWLISIAGSRFVPIFRKRYQASREAALKPMKWWVAAVGLCLACAYFGIGYHLSTAPTTITLRQGTKRELSREDRIRQRGSERMMIEAERALKEKDWDKVEEISRTYVMRGDRNHLMSYFRAIALYHQGKLLTNLLDFPQTFGVNSLFFPWEADKHRAEFGGYIFEELGAVNSANHWEFEALVGWGETSSHLTNLARYAIAQGKNEQARKFIAPLKKSLFYRSTARDLERQLAEGKVEGLRNSLADTPQTPARWDNVLNLGGDLRYILLSDPQNEMAKEYIAAFFLLANNLGAFYRNLKEFWPMPAEGYLPPMVEQGLTLVKMHIGDEQLAADGYRISPETEARFREFLTELNKGQNARFSPEMRRTYWYYVQRVSPYGKDLSF